MRLKTLVPIVVCDEIIPAGTVVKAMLIYTQVGLRYNCIFQYNGSDCYAWLNPQQVEV